MLRFFIIIMMIFYCFSPRFETQRQTPATRPPRCSHRCGWGPSLVVPGGQRATGPPTQGSPRPPNSLTCWPNINLQLQAGPVHHVRGGRSCGKAQGRGGGGFGGSVAQPPHGTGTPMWPHQPHCAHPPGVTKPQGVTQWDRDRASL